ncbi:phosphoribosylamine/glycine ligase [Denitrovibrio acetiphilus DSM 12809]|uniref:Phosphoribosylamine--glycine ligase n=1 Tax=Denitrovibrio acetiphilus (strain DSM 12809 / NBRC 114555 / N2460) TaxID=522772 RepID=D4H0M4_DENA2|nr:phosphoribosylamine--glycine ligase [Denitrovibrio acetiphilus]ADD68537.1 phosphoribosylamine/glycine ligase [Denitrovibrio acetiphilus DSM 12809]
MKILVIGGGGREHALCWKIAQSPLVAKIYAAPGNGGTDLEDKTINIDIKATDIEKLVEFAKTEKIDLTVVGPEDPLAMGIVNAFEKEGLRAFGPNADAAQLEASKAFAKEIMIDAGIPTAAYGEFTDLAAAKAYVEKHGAPIVVKADGLAAGKGVTVAKTSEEAIAALEEIFVDNAFGEAGSKVVIEEFLDGEEASYLAFTDGITVLPMVSSQDHKPAYDNDTGPNTGGMGAYSPAPVVTDELFNFATENIAYPLIRTMSDKGITFKGIIYAGLMVTKNGVKVLEFNARFGDPETQPVLSRLKSDIVPVFLACTDQTLDKVEIEWDENPTVCVVMASGGYPKSYEKGYEITGIADADKLEGVKVFHAGTETKNGKTVNTGGRVLGVTACGKGLEQTIGLAYDAVEKINWKDVHYRKDIGAKALKRMKK